jgi:hypothetical protein
VLAPALGERLGAVLGRGDVPDLMIGARSIRISISPEIGSAGPYMDHPERRRLIII